MCGQPINALCFPNIKIVQNPRIQVFVIYAFVDKVNVCLSSILQQSFAISYFELMFEYYQPSQKLCV